jgi:3-oxocholest-4-en-26-oyl-CoA dehydrogenase alpha subunit
VHLEETPEQLALREELRAYFAELLTPEVRASIDAGGSPSHSAVAQQVIRRMGADGWLGIGWPTEYGGQGRSALEQFVFFDEVQRAQAPFPFVTVNTVGPTIMRFGTDEQKRRFLPGILAGEIFFAIGYTEPDAGTDLASLKTRAGLDGDEYVVNGSKVFTSGADFADYVWLACRTDPDAPKHKGISILVVPTSSDGFKWTPIVTVGDVTTTATYYDDVRVPVANRIGDENAGWQMITTQLNHERVGLAALGGLGHQLWDETMAWARETGAIEQAWVRADLARAHALLSAMRLLNWRMAAAVAAGDLGPADSSAVKVYGTEALVDVYRTLLGILGPAGYVRPGSPGAALRGRLERAARAAQINTFGGGVNDVQRDIVAAAGLGMTRTARTAR